MGGNALWWSVLLGLCLVLLAPLFMFWILRYVTGVPPLEEQMLLSRGDSYRAYQARTSAFFPMPPKPLSDKSLPKESMKEATE